MHIRKLDHESIRKTKTAHIFYMHRTSRRPLTHSVKWDGHTPPVAQRCTVGRAVCNLKTQHHSWDFSLATPMATNADPPEGCTHACENVQGVGASVPPHPPSVHVTCVYANRSRCDGGGVAGDHSNQSWCVEGPALFSLHDADRLPVFVLFSISPPSS